MPKIFLSYAEEDGKFALEIIGVLRTILGNQWEIFYWEDPSKRGNRWIRALENTIMDADAFIALISPNYQNSWWCNQELDLALQRTKEFEEIGRQFFWVIKISSIGKTGFLNNYDLIDLTGPNREEKLKNFSERLNQMVKTLPKQPRVEPLPWPTFQNRRQELNDLIANLTNVAGEQFWQIISAPQMGKSWLLKQLTNELPEKESWHIIHVDLRNQPIDARINLPRLLSLLFNQNIHNPIDSNVITLISRNIVAREKRLLCILESAELLSDDTAEQLRKCLSQIYILVKDEGIDQVQLSFIAATRYPIHSWLGVVPVPRFESRTLSHFPIDVIERFLQETVKLDKRNKKDEWIKNISRQLSKASEGLPGLLVCFVAWIREIKYIFGSDSIESRDLFTSIIKPYIDEHLLSANSLITSYPDKNLIEPQRVLLERTLLALSIYRCFTEKYLHKFVEENNYLKAELQQANWEIKDLWKALRKTYLVEPSQEIMTSLYPSVRRLLFRYWQPTREEQLRAHQKAIDFYNENQTELFGADKAIILIEQLWHQVEYQRLDASKIDPSSLLNFASDLFKKGIQPNHYSNQDLAVFIEKRLLSDMELQESLAEIQKDLFTNIVANVSSYT